MLILLLSTKKITPVNFLVDLIIPRPYIYKEKHIVFPKEGLCKLLFPLLKDKKNNSSRTFIYEDNNDRHY